MCFGASTKLANWNAEDGSGIVVEIKESVLQALKRESTFANVLALRESGDLSQETTLIEAQKRNVISDKVVIEEEIGRTQAESASDAD